MEKLLVDVGTKHAPLHTMRVRGDEPQWMTDEIRIAMKTRDYLKHKTSKDKLEKDWIGYKLQRNKVTKLIDETKCTYYNDLLTKNANDTSKLWSPLKKLLPKKKNVSIQEMKFGESSSSDNKGIATILNKFFTSVADLLKP